MFEVGQVCIKIAGRDSNNHCVVVKKLDDNFVLIDGNVRRRKCSIKHLQPQKDKLELKEDASHEDVAKALEKAGIPVKVKKGFKGREKKAAKSPKQEKPAEPKKAKEEEPKKAKEEGEEPKKPKRAAKPKKAE